MIETKKDYIELQSMITGMINERDKPRCINCENNINGICNIFKANIPDDHEYKYTKCEHWKQGIPF